MPRRVREYPGVGPPDKAEPADRPRMGTRHLGQLPCQPAGRLRCQRNTGGARLAMYGGRATRVAAGQLGGERTRHDSRATAPCESEHRDDGPRKGRPWGNGLTRRFRGLQ
jgi:hypothetical protein